MVFLDLETTGFSETTDEIIEIAAIKYNDQFEEIDRLEFLFSIEKEIPEMVSRITGIYSQDIENAPSFASKKEEIQKFLDGEVIWGHNIAFDIKFLQASGIENISKSVDTCYLSLVFLPKQKSYSLEVLSDVFGISHENKHRAMSDVLASFELTRHIFSYIQKMPPVFFENLSLVSHKISPELFQAISSSYSGKRYQEKEDSLPHVSFSEKEIPSSPFLYGNAKDDLLSCVLYHIKKKNAIIAPLPLLEKLKTYFPEIPMHFPAKMTFDPQKIHHFLEKESYSLEEQYVFLRILYLQSFEKEISYHTLFFGIFFKTISSFFLEKGEEQKISGPVFLPFPILAEKNIHWETSALLIDAQEKSLDTVFSFSFFCKKYTHLLSIQKLSQILQDIFITEEINEYGLLKSFTLLDIPQDAQKSIQECLDSLEPEIPTYEKTVLQTFFSSKDMIRLCSITPQKEVSLSAYPYEYKNLLNLPKETQYYFFHSFESDSLVHETLFSEYEPYVSLEKVNTREYILPEKNAYASKHPLFVEYMYQKMDAIIENEPGRIVVLCTSKKQIEGFLLRYTNTETRVFTSTASGKYKALHNFEKESSVLFVHKDFVSEFVLENYEVSTVVIPKLPFDPYHAIYTKRGERFLQEGFSRYVLPKVSEHIQRTIRVFTPQKVFILDGSIYSPWAKNVKTIL
jgi:DNA polymerase III epsilon subunit-like protein